MGKNPKYFYYPVQGHLYTRIGRMKARLGDYVSTFRNMITVCFFLGGCVPQVAQYTARQTRTWGVIAEGRYNGTLPVNARD